MGELSPWHLLILAGVFVLLFGAKRLPDGARSLGRSLRIFKTEVKGLNDEDAQNQDQPQNQAQSPAQLPAAPPTAAPPTAAPPTAATPTEGPTAPPVATAADTTVANPAAPQHETR